MKTTTTFPYLKFSIRMENYFLFLIYNNTVGISIIIVRIMCYFKFIKHKQVYLFNKFCNNMQNSQISDQSISKIYTNQQGLNPQKYSNRHNKPKVKIQYINQNLDQAIQQIRNSINNNKCVQEVTKKYQSNKKLSQKLQQPDKQFHQNQFVTCYFTQNYKKKYEEKLKFLREKKMKLKVQSLEKAMGAKLQKKRKQNLQMKRKLAELKDINQRKAEMDRNRNNINNQKNKEHFFLHSCNEDRFQMLRKSKRTQSLKNLNQFRNQCAQSLNDLRFKRYSVQKQKAEHNMVLRSKLQLLRYTKSQKKHRSSIPKRDIKTSAQNRRNGASHQSEGQQLL